MCASGLKLGWVDPHIQVRWGTFYSRLFGLLGQAQKFQVCILSNIAVTNNTGDCSIREY